MEEVQTIIITGASGSMGSAAVEEMASRGWNVIMACRNIQKGDAIRGNILSRLPDAHIELLQLDLESFDSIGQFVLKLEGRRVDALFNNAGIINRSHALTRQGMERTFQVNCIAPAVLTMLLSRENLTPEARIVNMVSLTCSLVRIPSDYCGDSRRKFSQLGSYARSKLALLAFSAAFASRTGRCVNVSDPGIVNSNMISMHRWFDPLADLLFRPFCSSPQKGVQPALRALTGTGNMQYYVGKRNRKIASKYVSHPAGNCIYDMCEALIGEKFE